MRNGNAKMVMGLSKAESTKLWEGLSARKSGRLHSGYGLMFTDDFDQFWSVNDKIISDTAEQPLKNIPIRVYVPSTPRVIQQPISPFLETSQSNSCR